MQNQRDNNKIFGFADSVEKIQIFTILQNTGVFFSNKYGCTTFTFHFFAGYIKIYVFSSFGNTPTRANFIPLTNLHLKFDIAINVH